MNHNQEDRDKVLKSILDIMELNYEMISKLLGMERLALEKEDLHNLTPKFDNLNLINKNIKNKFDALHHFIRYLPTEGVPTAKQLREFAPYYFADIRSSEKLSLRNIYHKLATWLFDNKKKSIRDIEEKFGAVVAQQVQKFYDNGDHDT